MGRDGAAVSEQGWSTWSRAGPQRSPQYEVIIIGAGVCGIYQLYRLRRAGRDATVLEAGDDLGGTWFWNRYPGARFDSESITYGYSFSQELLQEWDWKERFSGQPENLRYLNYVADKFDLRQHMQFGCTVESAALRRRRHAAGGCTSTTAATLTCRFLITADRPAVGADAAALRGHRQLRGPRRSTPTTGPRSRSTWPASGSAVIGTGATGVQVIGAIADQVGELTVFQRRPNWCAPLHNARDHARGDGRHQAALRRDLRHLRPHAGRLPPRAGPPAVLRGAPRGAAGQVGEALRRARLRHLAGQLPRHRSWTRRPTPSCPSSSPTRSARAVDDPVVAEKLIPKDHGFGVSGCRWRPATTRPTTGHNVHLVDLQETPIERITPTGIRTTDGDYEFDIIVYATGFDADHRRLRPHRHPRRRRPDAARQVGRRPGHVLRHAGRRLPEHDHADRAAERVGVDELPPRASRSASTG